AAGAVAAQRLAGRRRVRTLASLAAFARRRAAGGGIGGLAVRRMAVGPGCSVDACIRVCGPAAGTTHGMVARRPSDGGAQWLVVALLALRRNRQAAGAAPVALS